MKPAHHGGVEFGGTKTICAVGDDTGVILDTVTIPTTTVPETLNRIQEFFGHYPSLTTLGVGSFGPVEINPTSSLYGHILNAPKPGWANTDLKGELESRLQLPIALDTDVNCAALGEQQFGVAKAAQHFVYITIGTGIGGGVMQGGRIQHGASHLELGHMPIPHEPFTGEFRGVCPFHGDCLEGIASGPAMEKRWGKSSRHITDPAAWKTEAEYLATAVYTLSLTLAPELIVLGGGVMNQPGLIEQVRAGVEHQNRAYVSLPPLNTYVVRSTNTLNGVQGALLLR
jgi:fructokinase